PLHVVVECVDPPSCTTLGLDDQRVEHALSRRLVRRQRHPPYGAVLIAELAPPLLRPYLDRLAALRITLLNLLLVQVCHRSQISKTPPTPGGTRGTSSLVPSRNSSLLLVARWPVSHELPAYAARGADLAVHGRLV